MSGEAADLHFAREYLDHMEATTVNPVLLRAIRAARADLPASSSAGAVPVGRGDTELREQIEEAADEAVRPYELTAAQRRAIAAAVLALPALQGLVRDHQAVERAAKLADAWIDYEETEADPLSHHALIASAGRDLRRALGGEQP